ncbi:chalcone--flavanone isomerase-like [Coffea arabica]|uniref:Chalcone-flavonone isomerase family protein n=1 Tax=Coffea arabica TaxID=13443 RepID=A0A6P6WZX4_COFAR|nr:chalcone--flavonone isomerase-like [Coffea arabica]
MILMAPAFSVSEVEVEGHVFPSSMKPSGSNGTFFLGGAGYRGLEIQGKFIKFSLPGVYLEETAIPSLAAKWKGKTAEELMESVEFFRDIITGPFEKFIRLTFLKPLTGEEFSKKVSEDCADYLKVIGSYTDAEDKAIEKFHDIFKNESFQPGDSILYSQSPLGSLRISFSKHDSIPEVSGGVVENKPLSETVLESIIGRDGVSPSTRKSLAVRVSDLLKVSDTAS